MARGEAVATYTPPEGAATVVRKPFTARVVLPPRLARNLAASTRICQVLFLQLDQLRLELLGLIVEIPERVTLRVTADSNGGVLGSLFCALAEADVPLPVP